MSLLERTDWSAVARWASRYAVIFVMAVLATALGLLSVPKGSHAAPLGALHWPAGVALAAFMRYGSRAALAVVSGLVIGVLLVLVYPGYPIELPSAAAVPLVDAVCAWLAARWLHRRGVELAAPTRADLAFLGAAVVIAALVASAPTILVLRQQLPEGRHLAAFGAHAIAWALAALLVAGPAGGSHPHRLVGPALLPPAIVAAAALAAARGWTPEAWTSVVSQWTVGAALASMTLGMLVWLGARARDPGPWASLFDAARVGIASWVGEGHDAYTSPRWRTLLADPDGHATASFDGLLSITHEDHRHVLRLTLSGLQKPGNDRFKIELRLMAGEGWRWFEITGQVPDRRADGTPVRLVLAIEDITERRSAADREHLSDSLFQHLHEGLLITDAQMRVLDVNPTYLKILGHQREELIGQVPPLLRATGEGTLQAQHATMWSALQNTGTWRGELSERRRNGDPCILQVTITVVRGSDSLARYHVLVISDITEQRRQRDRLERQAHYDELTRLPNRARLAQLLAEGMAATKRDSCLLAVCYLDLDHFKPVNDRYGHAAGDRLLIELARRLRGALRSHPVWSDRAARLGGDEFALLLRASSVEEARLAVERVLRVASMPYEVADGEPPETVTASIGVTIYPIDDSDPDTLLRHADHAMYGAKQTGRNGYLIFDPVHSRKAEERISAISRMQQALDQHEFVLHYQPKVDMRRGTVLGMEALLRWAHPVEGLIAPGLFLPIIERSDLLSVKVGDWVLDQALSQLAYWQTMGLDLSVSVNMSANHLEDHDFAPRLAELISRHGRQIGGKLELEVLETEALKDVARTSSLLDRCRKLGVRFALDDFGTGYSTLSYLKRLPVDVLKIDRSFVHNMLDDRQDLAIVEGVIGLARTFDCTVVAEGVETAAQARLLLDLGCDVGQGHGIAVPMPASEIAEWMRNYRGPFTLTQAAAPAAQLPASSSSSSPSG